MYCMTTNIRKNLRHIWEKQSNQNVKQCLGKGIVLHKLAKRYTRIANGMGNSEGMSGDSREILVTLPRSYQIF